jgi:hypothetical protein
LAGSARGFSGLGGITTHSASSDRSQYRVVRHWYRERDGAISTGRRDSEPARRLLNSFLSPVVKYHGLGRATGFGNLRPCYTLGILLDVAMTASSAVDWQHSPEREGLRRRPFKLTTLRPAFPSDPPDRSRLTPPAKTHSTTDRAGDSPLALSLPGCATSACSGQEPSPGLRPSSGPCR